MLRSGNVNKENTIDLIQNMNIDEKIGLDDIPEIDLYMDQVIQLFESKLSKLKRKEEDKVLTKTMINNYAKAKLLMSVKNKKYSKEHLILMSFIYNFKGAISINDIKLMLETIVNKYENGEEYDLRSLYERYLKVTTADSNELEDSVKKKVDKLSDISKEDDFEEKFLLVSSMISMSNMYRRIGEQLIDKFFGEESK
ncbi:DUF1836 domain-containing protein [Clostridium sp. Sa3CVN1]|uniref:DUF1836 domain-containing protein n=2 Tax=Clostridiaceae TaxID=31979 RepID=A0ABR8PRR4_9CLOT|nr:DUF1836 domain-containing protein [Clostridium cibarium]